LTRRQKGLLSVRSTGVCLKIFAELVRWLSAAVGKL
jgi:hypothetical protein